MSGDGYRRVDVEASMPRPADPDHRISHDALLSPGGVAGKVGGFYRAPDTSEYERARGEAAAIKVCASLRVLCVHLSARHLILTSL